MEVAPPTASPAPATRADSPAVYGKPARGLPWEGPPNRSVMVSYQHSILRGPEDYEETPAGGPLLVVMVCRPFLSFAKNSQHRVLPRACEALWQALLLLEAGGLY